MTVNQRDNLYVVCQCRIFIFENFWPLFVFFPSLKCWESTVVRTVVMWCLWMFCAETFPAKHFVGVLIGVFVCIFRFLEAKRSDVEKGSKTSENHTYSSANLREAWWTESGESRRKIESKNRVFFFPVVLVTRAVVQTSNGHRWSLAREEIMSSGETSFRKWSMAMFWDRKSILGK